MPIAKITINGATSSFAVVPIGSTVNLTNDGDGAETSFLWAVATGSQPSGSYDGFDDPTSETPTFTPNKEGSYAGTLIVDADQTLTASFVVAVRHMKSWLRSPAAGEKTEESGSYGWARALQEIHDKLDDEVGDGGTVVGLAKTALTRGELVRPTGSLFIKSGSVGEERILEFGRVSGEATGSFQSTLFMVEGEVASGSNSDPISGSLFTARYMGIFGPLTGTDPATGDEVFARDDGVISLALGSTDRKLGNVVSTDGSTYYIHFDGTADRRPSDGAGVDWRGILGVEWQQAGAAVETTATASFTGSGGIVVSVSEAGGIATIDISGSVSAAASGGGIIGVEWQETGSLEATAATASFTGSGGILVSVNDDGGVTTIAISGTEGLTGPAGPTGSNVVDVHLDGVATVLTASVIDFTGSGGIVVSVTDEMDGTATVDVSGTVSAGTAGALTYVDTITVTTTTASVWFGDSDGGATNGTALDGDTDGIYFITFRASPSSEADGTHLQFSPNGVTANLLSQRISLGNTTEDHNDGWKISRFNASTDFSFGNIEFDPRKLIAGFTANRFYTSRNIWFNGTDPIGRAYNGIWTDMSSSVSTIKFDLEDGSILSGSEFILYKRSLS